MAEFEFTAAAKSVAEETESTHSVAANDGGHIRGEFHVMANGEPFEQFGVKGEMFPVHVIRGARENIPFDGLALRTGVVQYKLTFQIITFFKKDENGNPLDPVVRRTWLAENAPNGTDVEFDRVEVFENGAFSPPEGTMDGWIQKIKRDPALLMSLK